MILKFSPKLDMDTKFKHVLINYLTITLLEQQVINVFNNIMRGSLDIINIFESSHFLQYYL